MIFRTKVSSALKVFAGLLIGWVTFFSSPVLAQDVTLSTSSFGDTTHFEFSGKTNWNYQFETANVNKQKIVELRVDELSATEVNKLKGTTGPLIDKVVYVAKSAKGFPILQFYLKDQNVEAFDYQTEMPSRYVLDFFYPEGMTASTKKTASKPVVTPDIKTVLEDQVAKVAPAEKAAVAKEVAKTDGKGKSKNRGPALSDAGAQVAAPSSDLPGPKPSLGLFDGGDPQYDRFLVGDHEINEDAIILSQENYYVKFPRLDFDLAIHKSLEKNKPIYNIVPALTEENREARLVYKLFERKRLASFLKTLAWFRKKYPKSEYLEPMAFMEADTYLGFWQESKSDTDFQKVTDMYSALLDKYPASVLNERTSLLLGQLFLLRNNMPSAVRHFHRHIESAKNYSKESKQIAQMAMAYCLANLNRFGEAYRLYEDLTLDKTSPEIAAEAKFRKGDVFFAQGDFARAAEDYKKAIIENPESVTKLPNALFNHGESLFRTKQFRGALLSYIDHLKKYPNHPHSVYALTRVGEILEILGVDETKVMGAFLETAFRFGEVPSTLVARLRILTRRMKGMKKAELENVLKELSAMTQESQLENIQQFYNVMVSDGYQKRGEFSKAIELLASYLKAFPSTADKNMLAQRISKNINLGIKQSIQSGDFIKALEQESHYANSWLKTSNRLDTQFYVGQAFELAGVPQRAKEYYQALYNSMQTLKGTPEEKRIKLTQSLPSQDQVLLRLAVSQFQTQKIKDAFETIKNIQAPEKLDFKEQIERVLLVTRLLDKKGDQKGATLYLSDVLEEWKSKPADVAPLYLELAQMEKSLNEKEKALASIQRLENLWQDSQKGFDEEVMVRALKLKISLLTDAKDKAVKQVAIEGLLEQFEETRALGSYRYDLGLIYLDNGDLKKAEAVWSGFKGQASNSWQKLASDRMQTSEWRESYKRYLKRIPAMASQQETNP